MKNIKSVIRKNLKTIQNEHLIYLRYTYNRRYILFRVDEYVIASNWNVKSGRVRKSFNYDKKNQLLDNAEKNLQTLILNMRLENLDPTLLNVKNEYFKTKNKFVEQTGPKKIDEKRFLNDFQEFIDEREYNKSVGKETIKTYKGTKNKLIEFQKNKSYSLHYDTLDDKFYYEFLNYLRIDCKLFDNSIDKHIKNLKLFMNYALEKKKHNNNFYHTFKRTRAKADFVFLEFDEIRKLYYDYKPLTKSQENIRDTFVLGCSTGLRFSDLIKLSRGNFVITRDKISNEILQDATSSYINVDTLKTSEKVRIPLNYFITDLIEKYDIENKEITFLKHNNQVFNREIKKICETAGITSVVKVSKKKGSEYISTEKLKCKYVSSHTMRRSFITILSSMTEASNIQAVSGHKDIRILTDYIKHNDKELNSIRACFNTLFYDKKNVEDPNKVKIHLKGTKVISGQ